MSVSFIPFAFPGLTNVRCVFQTRPGGASRGPYGGGNISFSTADEPAHVAANRCSLLQSLRAGGLAAWAELNQVHGDALVFEPEPIDCEAQPTLDGDGLASSSPGLGLLIKTADCQPVLLAHRGGRHIAALHAGWRGNRCNFPGTAVARFCAHYGLRPRDLLAVRGPSLGPEKAEFVNFEQEWSAAFRPWFDPISRTMDLWGLTRAQLLEAGLLPRHIYGLDCCTFSLPGQFFSYRREKKSGRQASLIWMAS